MNLTVKFILSITVLIILIISLVILNILSREESMILNQIKSKGKVLIEILAMSSVNSLLNYEYSTLKRYTETVVKDRDVISIMILDRNFTVKMHNNLDLLGTTVNDQFNNKAIISDGPVFQFNDSYPDKEYVYEIAAPIIAETQTIGLIRIAFSGNEMMLSIRESRNQLIMIGLIAVIIGISGAVFMSNMISKPIKRLADGAREVAKGNLKWNINIKSRDEIGVLAASFESMTYNLKKHIDTLVRTEKFAILGKLASVIAHEVRNPMEPIKSSAKILEDKYNDKTIQKYTSIIKEEINCLCKFLDEFLEFTRPQEPVLNNTDINNVIHETLSLSEHYIHKNNITVKISLSENLPEIPADSRQLKQVFMNLIMNSIQGKKENSSFLEIKSYLKKTGKKTITEKTKHDSIIIEFYDNGKGIPKENINSIFDPFFTTKKDGSGIGLSISQFIIDRHNGKIKISSRENEWTRVIIKFPVPSITGQKYKT